MKHGSWLELVNKPLYAFALLWTSYSLSFGDLDSGHNTEIVLKQLAYDVMLKSQNLPMTTREPISDAKAGEFLLPSSSWGSHRYRRIGYREEPGVLGYIAYIGSVHEKKNF